MLHHTPHRLSTTAKHTLTATILSLVCSSALSTDDPTVLINWDSHWHYHDSDEAAPQGWQEKGFDHADWKSGPSPFGYDTANRMDRWPEPHPETQLQPSLISYAFRHAFAFTGDPANTTILFDLIIDDGAVIFLNGVEVARTHTMPEGPVNASTTTEQVVSIPERHDNAFRIPGTALTQGDNVLAVSLHNHRETSSDICLALRMRVIDEKYRSEPPGLILTWQEDPTTSITIDWHRLPEQTEATEPVIQARPRGTADWHDFPAERFPFPHSDRMIDRVEIKGLQPNTEYEFRGDPESRTYWFRTMPAKLERPVTFAAGGDVRHRRSWMEQTNRMAMLHDPDFIVWGGDLAYADGRPDRVNLWYEYLEVMVQTLVTDDGRVPPVVVGIGNHEVQGGYHRDRFNSDEDKLELAPFFYNLFAFPGIQGYNTLDFGNYLSFIVTDTDHSTPVVGEQTRWLRRALAERRDFSHLIPVNHVPAWPSHRSFDGSISAAIREHWVPLFEHHGIRLVLENHDHTYKRTIPIYREREDKERGIVYLGDGCWGVGTRSVHSVEETWYLKHAESTRHALIITVHPDRLDVDARDSDNNTIDSVTVPARR